MGCKYHVVILYTRIHGGINSQKRFQLPPTSWKEMDTGTQFKMTEPGTVHRNGCIIERLLATVGKPSIQVSLYQNMSLFHDYKREMTMSASLLISMPYQKPEEVISALPPFSISFHIRKSLLISKSVSGYRVLSGSLYFEL